MVAGEEAGREYKLPFERFTIGRGTRNRVVIAEEMASRVHAELRFSRNRFLLKDAGSTNGTRVNGQRVRRAALLPNDTLAIANMKYIVKFGVELEKLEKEEALKIRNDAAAHQLRRNALPDVYPESKAPKG